MFKDMFVAISGNSPMIQALLGGMVIAFLNMLGSNARACVAKAFGTFVKRRAWHGSWRHAHRKFYQPHHPRH